MGFFEEKFNSLGTFSDWSLKALYSWASEKKARNFYGYFLKCPNTRRSS